jgi:hypothetical protein
MTVLRIINLVCWGAMLAYMLPGAWASLGRRARYGDPMRLACALTGFVVIGFNLRWLIAPNDVVLWKGLLVLSSALAIFILHLGLTYGRGSLLANKGAKDHE